MITLNKFAVAGAIGLLCFSMNASGSGFDNAMGLGSDNLGVGSSDDPSGLCKSRTKDNAQEVLNDYGADGRSEKRKQEDVISKDQFKQVSDSYDACVKKPTCVSVTPDSSDGARGVKLKMATNSTNCAVENRTIRDECVSQQKAVKAKTAEVGQQVDGDIEKKINEINQAHQEWVAQGNSGTAPQEAQGVQELRKLREKKNNVKALGKSSNRALADLAHCYEMNAVEQDSVAQQMAAQAESIKGNETTAMLTPDQNAAAANPVDGLTNKVASKGVDKAGEALAENSEIKSLQRTAPFLTAVATGGTEEVTNTAVKTGVRSLAGLAAGPVGLALDTGLALGQMVGPAGGPCDTLVFSQLQNSATGGSCGMATTQSIQVLNSP